MVTQWEQRFLRCAGGGDQIRDQLGAAGGLVVDDDHRVRDEGMTADARLDFAEFDAVAADLDLEVVAADVFECAVGQPAAQVPVRYRRVPSPVSQSGTKRSAVSAGRPR